MSFLKQWKEAKNKFQTITKKKRPKPDFVSKITSIFSKNEKMTPAVKSLDSAFDMTFKDMKSLDKKFACIVKSKKAWKTASSKYMALVKSKISDGKDADDKLYVSACEGLCDDINLISGCVNSMYDEFCKVYPIYANKYNQGDDDYEYVDVSAAGLILKVNDIYSKCNSKYFSLDRVPMYIGFPDKLFVVGKEVREEYDGFIQNIIMFSAEESERMMVEICKKVKKYDDDAVDVRYNPKAMNKLSSDLTDEVEKITEETIKKINDRTYKIFNGLRSKPKRKTKYENAKCLKAIISIGKISYKTAMGALTLDIRCFLDAVKSVYDIAESFSSYYKSLDVLEEEIDDLIVSLDVEYTYYFEEEQGKNGGKTKMSKMDTLRMTSDMRGKLSDLKDRYGAYCKKYNEISDAEHKKAKNLFRTLSSEAKNMPNDFDEKKEIVKKINEAAEAFSELNSIREEKFVFMGEVEDKILMYDGKMKFVYSVVDSVRASVCEKLRDIVGGLRALAMKSLPGPFSNR